MLKKEDMVWRPFASFYYYFCYDTFTKKLLISDTCMYVTNNIYFKSEEKVKQCIESVGCDRILKYYLKVND